MPLSNFFIRRALEMGHIKIDPFHQNQLGMNSYDVRIGPWYYTLDPDRLGLWGAFDPRVKADVMRYYVKHYSATTITVPAGGFILAHTIESIGGMPGSGIRGEMSCRSSWARAGLKTNSCAGLGDVGYCRRWTMELRNDNSVALIIPVGARIAQIEFEDCGITEGDYADNGKYTGDWTPEDMLPKIYDDWDRENSHTFIRGDLAPKEVAITRVAGLIDDLDVAVKTGSLDHMRDKP